MRTVSGWLDNSFSCPGKIGFREWIGIYPFAIPVLKNNELVWVVDRFVARGDISQKDLATWTRFMPDDGDADLADLIVEQLVAAQKGGACDISDFMDRREKLIASWFSKLDSKLKTESKGQSNEQRVLEEM